MFAPLRYPIFKENVSPHSFPKLENPLFKNFLIGS
jgi:hypothetical protein